ncbi:MAG: hypothetical protein KBD01_16165 [Acidobacteria bacterium]|nr:hypothetical protein [Acidobacteriota bacterium]
MKKFGEKAELLYAALIGDLVRSREAPDRADLQRRFREAVAALNAGPSRAALAAPLSITAGDEVQGLLREPAAAVEIVRRLGEAVRPSQIAFGLGWGPVSTDIVARSTEIDGPCFHRAREALGVAAKRGDWLSASGFGEPTDTVLTALYDLMGAIVSRWTDTQARYAAAARDALQKDVAEQFGVSPSVVSESLKSAALDAILSGEAAARSLLSQFGKRGEHAPASADKPK